MQAWLRRGRMAALTITSGGLLALAGCDPAVRDTVLNGVSGAAAGLSSTFIQAFFQSLLTEEEVPTTVRAIFEVAQQFLA